MIKKRDEKRIPFRKLAICKCGEEIHPGFIQDVSQHGIGIQTMQPSSLNLPMRIALAVGTDSIILDGEVRWAHQPIGPYQARPRQMGVFILKPPAGYLRLVAECSDNTRPRPSMEPLK